MKCCEIDCTQKFLINCPYKRNLECIVPVKAYKYHCYSLNKDTGKAITTIAVVYLHNDRNVFEVINHYNQSKTGNILYKYWVD
jgi:hypothetical protein